LATLDAQSMFDGGWLLPLGQESDLSEMVAAYRQLPPITFTMLADSTQPVTVARRPLGIARICPWSTTRPGGPR